MVCVGSVFLKDHAKGTVIEIDYKPSSSAQCHKLLDEFIGYLGPFDADTQQYVTMDNTNILTANNIDINCMQNTTLEYVSVFKSMGILAK